MDSAMDMDDPLDWSVEQVVAALCDRKNPWLQVNANSVVPDLDALAKSLRDNLINGLTLLTTVNDHVLREDLGLKALGHRAFVSRAIRKLRTNSVKFREQELEVSMHTPIPSLQCGLSDMSRSPPYADFSHLSPQAISFHSHLYEQRPMPKHFLDSTTGQATLRHAPGSMSLSPERSHQFLGQNPHGDLSQFRSQGITSFAPPESHRLKFSNVQRGPITDNQGKSVINQQALEASPVQPAQDMVFRETDNREKVAPTLNSKDIVKLEHRPSPHSASVAGKVTVDGKERKRLAPTLIAQTSMASHGDWEFPLAQAALRASPDILKSVQTPFGAQNRTGWAREFPDPYLGIKKVPVDNLFFGDARIGQELPGDNEDDDNFVIMPEAQIPNGCRLYVNKLMRHYLFKPVQITFSRNGMFCHAIRPYSAKILRMLPNKRKQSFMLLSPSSHTFRVTREDISLWPEVSADGTLIEMISPEPSSTTQNLLDSQEEDGNHEWDFLLKWQHTGSDIIPAQLGESGSEGEYDLDTWNEIEQEHGRLDEILGKTGKRTLRKDEVNQAIDDGINELVAKWELEKLPKRELKAWSIWKKSRREGTKRIQIREAQHHIEQINEARLGKMRKEIVTEIWTKAAAVRRQCRIMEQSVFDREDLRWTISLLERKREPERPPPRPKKEKEPKIARQLYSDEDEDVEVLGSGTDGFESGWDGDELGDFIIDDSTQGRENVEDADTEMADVEDAEVESADEELTPRTHHKSPAGNSFDSPIHGMDDDDDDDDDVPMSDLPMASRDVASVLMTAASSPLSSTRTLTTPNVTLPNTPTKDKSTHMPQLTTASPRNRQSAFIDLTLSDPAELPNPFRDGKKAPRRGRDVSEVAGSATKGGKAIGEKENVIDLAASSGDDLRYDSLKGVSVEEFEKTGDRKRLVIFIVGAGMNDRKRRLLAMRLAEKTRGALRHDSLAGLSALSRGAETTFSQANDNNQTVMRLTRLFLCWIQCKRQPWDEKPSAELLRLAESRKEFFIFRRFLREVLRQYEPDILEDIPINHNTDIETRRDRDKPPPQKKMKKVEPEKVNVVTQGFDTDIIGESQNPSSRNKRKRPVFENLSARNMRENDRLRLLDQEKRRAQLEKQLAKVGTTSAGDPSRIIVNTGKFEDQELIFLNEHIGKRIKPHQIQGVQFMWRELVTDEKSLQGCLLAHTMGLGKTMQVITLLVTIAEAAKSANPNISNQIPASLRQSRSLILCPPSLIDNWWDELLIWAPQPMEKSIGQLRKVDSSMTNLARRRSEISAWYDEGGVLIMSYDIFRNFVLNKTSKAQSPLLGVEQHKILKKELLGGPNIIVADEAHRLKNTGTLIAVAVAQLRSRSRIALTGSPLANSLEEYHSMIDWVAPGYLGPLVEFKAKYVEPIQDGLYSDSSLPERRRCLKMLRVLKNDLDPKVNRVDISVLKGSLPPKTEFVIKVSLTKVQEDAYKRYVQSMLSGSNGEVGNARLWDWLAILSVLCNHPLCFKNKLLERDRKDTSQGNPTPTSAGTSDEDPVEDGQVELAPGDAPVSKVGMTPAIIKQQIAALDQVGNGLGSTIHSHKVRICNEIIDASIKAGDKVLVFSHSIPTLDYLESLLANSNLRYSRLDGNTKMSERQKATKAFNLNKTDVYLVSTGAGGLGLNLYGANRVIIFDFNFNPTWEEQAVGRAYRIGQKKPVYVYRFISAGTFEEVIHNKAVFKMQLASRVVDKKNPTRYATKKGRDYLFEPIVVDQKDLSEYKGKDSNVLDKVLAAHKEDNCVISIELTETFQRDDDDKLTAEEEQEADQLLRDEQLKRADPGAYNKMIVERQKATVAKVHAKNVLIGSHLPPSPLSTASPREKTSASAKVAESSAPIETPSSSAIKAKPALESESYTSPRFRGSVNLGPPITEKPASLTHVGGESDSAAYEHPTSPKMNSGKVPDQSSQISPFVSAFLEDEKRRDAGGR